MQVQKQVETDPSPQFRENHNNDYGLFPVIQTQKSHHNLIRVPVLQKVPLNNVKINRQSKFGQYWENNNNLTTPVSKLITPMSSRSNSVISIGS